MDTSFGTDASIGDEVALEVERRLEGWEDRRRSLVWDSGVGSLTYPTAFANSAQLKQASSECINPGNMIVVQDLFEYRSRLNFDGRHAKDEPHLMRRWKSYLPTNLYRQGLLARKMFAFDRER